MPHGPVRPYDMSFGAVVLSSVVCSAQTTQRMEKYVMKCILITGRIALACTLFATTIAAGQGWDVVDTIDPLTDAPIRKTCSVQDEMRLCFSFQADGVWAAAQSMGDHLFDAQRFPAMRVDRNKVVYGVSESTMWLERTSGIQVIPREWEPRHISWRAQVPSTSGDWTETPPPLVAEMIDGSKLLVRYYLTSGLQKDVIYSLQGFCQSAAKVYAPDAPPLKCKSVDD